MLILNINSRFRINNHKILDTTEKNKAHPGDPGVRRGVAGPLTFCTDLDGHQGDAGTHVLEGQVETLPGHGSDLPDLGVETEHTVAQVCLSKALVGRDRVYL